MLSNVIDLLWDIKKLLSDILSLQRQIINEQKMTRFELSEIKSKESDKK